MTTSAGEKKLSFKYVLISPAMKMFHHLYKPELLRQTHVFEVIFYPNLLGILRKGEDVKNIWFQDSVRRFAESIPSLNPGPRCKFS